MPFLKRQFGWNPGARPLHRILAALAAATLLTAGLAVGVAADIYDQGWPTTCVDLNDIVEGHLGNDHNVGIYQQVFGDQAEIACQNDHGSDVRETFVWAFRDPDPQTYCRHHAAWPTGIHLGHLHPYYVNWYMENHGAGEFAYPCSAWASDQRDSAVRGLRAMGYTVIPPEERIRWGFAVFHGLSVFITDADGDRIEVASTGAGAGVPETPLLLVHHAEMEGRLEALVERRISAWIDGERVNWHGTGYAKSASSTWVIASGLYYPQHTPAFPIEHLLGAETLVLEISPDAGGSVPPIRVEMDLGGDMGVMHPIYIILREHEDYVDWARAQGWPIL